MQLNATHATTCPLVRPHHVFRPHTFQGPLVSSISHQPSAQGMSHSRHVSMQKQGKCCACRTQLAAQLWTSSSVQGGVSREAGRLRGRPLPQCEDGGHAGGSRHPSGCSIQDIALCAGRRLQGSWAPLRMTSSATLRWRTCRWRPPSFWATQRARAP